LWAIHWMQNEMWARLKTHKSWCVQQFLKFLIIKISQILCSWHMFKVWLLISNSTLFKDIMFWSNQLHVNYKSHVSQPTIIIYHTKVLKSLKLFCACCYLKVHDSHSNAFEFHIFIQQLHFKT
jgi:hypothetical protein